MGFSGGSAGKESTCNAGELGSIPGLGRSPGGGKGYPLQYSGLENSMDCIVQRIAKSCTQLIDFHFHCCLKLFCGKKNVHPSVKVIHMVTPTTVICISWHYRRDLADVLKDFETDWVNEGRGSWVRKCRQPLEAGKVNKINISLKPPKKTTALLTTWF